MPKPDHDQPRDNISYTVSVTYDNDVHGIWMTGYTTLKEAADKHQLAEMIDDRCGVKEIRFWEVTGRCVAVEYLKDQTAIMVLSK